jgi:polyribonucleotide 5'-hydroxyl-kinase
MLDKSEGVVERDKDAIQQVAESSIREYFFGNAKTTLSPYTQMVGFDSLTIYKVPDREFATHSSPTRRLTASPASIYYDEEFQRAEVSASMSHWTLAIMNASLHDPPETVRLASVIGFVYVGDVDVERHRMRLLSPVSGRLGDRPFIWARWPEPYVNLLG